MISHHYLEDLVRNLSLESHPELIHKRCQLHQQIDQILRKNLNHFHRTFVGGSCAKGTALFNCSDLDIMVFITLPAGQISVSNYIRQRKRCLKEMQRIISQHFSTISQFNLQAPYYSLFFTFDNIKVDLVVALNLIKRDDIEPNDIPTFQYKQAIQLIHQDKERKPWMNAFELSSSMSESVVKFVNGESCFVKSFIILCKHWFTTYFSGIHFGGRSSTIELIGITVGRQFQQERNLRVALRRFLFELSNLDKMRINLWCNYQEWGKINLRYVDKSCPCLIDPQNAYNNRLKRVKPDQMREIKKLAVKYEQEFDINLSSLFKDDSRMGLLKLNTAMTNQFTWVSGGLLANENPRLYKFICVLGIFTAALFLISFAFLFSPSRKESIDTKSPFQSYISEQLNQRKVIEDRYHYLEEELNELMRKLNDVQNIFATISSFYNKTLFLINDIINLKNDTYEQKIVILKYDYQQGGWYMDEDSPKMERKLFYLNQAMQTLNTIDEIKSNYLSEFLSTRMRSLNFELIKLKAIFLMKFPDGANIEGEKESLDQVSLQQPSYLFSYEMEEIEQIGNIIRHFGEFHNDLTHQVQEKVKSIKLKTEELFDGMKKLLAKFQADQLKYFIPKFQFIYT